MNRTRRAFDYQPPTYEEATKISTERRGRGFDSFIKQDGPSYFKPKSGDNFIRILPPTWENARHYAYHIRIHRDVGPDRQTYLCPKENDLSPDKECPVCAERYEIMRRHGSQKDADLLRPQSTLLIYLIDRSNEDSGPVIWGISNKSDLEILAQSLEKRQQRYLPIAHPIDGYDVEFVRDGEARNTRYRGFKVARTSSPIHDDADTLEQWLNYIEENPIPDMLQFYPAERIKSVFFGGAPVEEDEERPSRIRDEQVREEVRERVRPPPRETARETTPEPNGHADEPPFDTNTTAAETRRAPLEPRERPAPRDVEQPTRRATLSSPDNTSGSTIEALRARLQRNSGN